MVLKMSESMAPIVRSSRIRPSFTRVCLHSLRAALSGSTPAVCHHARSVADAMDCAVMGAAQRYSEFVARLAAERLRLHVAKMMRVRWVTLPTEGRVLRQHRQHRLRPCSRVDGCRLGLHLLDRAAVVLTDDRDRYRGRC